ncbi:MAG: hypothetical protein WBZ33_07960, partial [Thermoactinomyces sp.]
MDEKKEFSELNEEFLELIAGDSPTDYWTQIQKWAGNLLKDEGALTKIIESLANLNRTQTQKNTNSQGGNSGSQGGNSGSQGGNSGSQGGNSDSNKNGAAKNQIKQGSKSSNDNGANITGDSLYDV